VPRRKCACVPCRAEIASHHPTHSRSESRSRASLTLNKQEEVEVSTAGPNQMSDSNLSVRLRTSWSTNSRPSSRGPTSTSPYTESISRDQSSHGFSLRRRPRFFVLYRQKHRTNAYRGPVRSSLKSTPRHHSLRWAGQRIGPATDADCDESPRAELGPVKEAFMTLHE
jgi:hypothetical protein